MGRAPTVAAVTDEDDEPPAPWAQSAGWRWVPDHDEGIVGREHTRRMMEQVHRDILASLTAYARTLKWVVTAPRRRPKCEERRHE